MEQFECDKCGAPGQRYWMQFPDDERKRFFDRCVRHNRKLEALREEVGTWEEKGRRSTYKVRSLDEVLAERKPK